MLFQLDQTGGAVSEDSILFSGDFDFARDGQNWEAAFYESGTLRFAADPGLVDIFLVANGQTGGTGSQSGSFWYSGKGGDGGRYVLKTVRLRRGVDYAITIGAASDLSGADLDLDTDNTDDDTHAGASGGTAAKVASGSVSQANTGGSPGVWAYAETEDTTLVDALEGKRFCCGGGAGDCTVSGTSSASHGGVNDGGETDGGDGGSSDTTAQAGGAHTGSGGGGGFTVNDSGGPRAGAPGGSGVMLVRKHREVAA